MKTLLGVLGIIITLLGIKIYGIPGIDTSNFDIPYVHIPFLEGEFEHPKIKVEKEPRTQISRQITTPRETTNPSLYWLMEALRIFEDDYDKSRFIKTNINSMPDYLSLAKLNDILDLFDDCYYMFQVTRLFQSRLNPNYSDNDYRKFLNHFTDDYYRTKAINLLLRK